MTSPTAAKQTKETLKEWRARRRSEAQALAAKMRRLYPEVAAAKDAGRIAFYSLAATWDRSA